MAIKDILLPLIGEPSEAARASVFKCVGICGDLGAKVTGLAFEEPILVRPQVKPPSGSEHAAVRSVTDAQGLLESFDGAAAIFDVRCVTSLQHMASSEILDTVASAARLCDISLVPVRSHHAFSERLVERLLFESGRPLILCPEELAGDLPLYMDNILIAWDGSAPAARAVGDALPILKAAARVRVVTATDSATPDELGSCAALADHLAEHGIQASFETVAINGSSVGKVLEAHVKMSRIDLLVMGGFHHSRLNETVWGGVSRTVIAQPPCWVMMSH